MKISWKSRKRSQLGQIDLFQEFFELGKVSQTAWSVSIWLRDQIDARSSRRRATINLGQDHPVLNTWPNPKNSCKNSLWVQWQPNKEPFNVLKIKSNYFLCDASFWKSVQISRNWRLQGFLCNSIYTMSNIGSMPKNLKLCTVIRNAKSTEENCP